MKEKLDEKDYEIARLKNTINLNIEALNSKDEEMQAMKTLMKFDKKAEDFVKENEILDLKQRNVSLNRKVDEMLNNNKKLKQ